MLRPADKSIQDAVKMLCHQYHLKELAVFGSVATGMDREDSDVDILIDPESGYPLTFFDLAHLQDHLEELFHKQVDLVTKHGLSPFMAQRVLAQRVVLYAE